MSWYPYRPLAVAHRLRHWREGETRGMTRPRAGYRDKLV
jgi:hypothetical protein